MPLCSEPPALLTQMSSRPISATVRVTRPRTTSASVMSPGMPIARRPRASISATTSSISSVRRAVTTTSAPQSASPIAMPRPMPRPEPVTTATLPSSRKESSREGVVVIARRCHVGHVCSGNVESRQDGGPDDVEHQTRQPRPESDGVPRPRRRRRPVRRGRAGALVRGLRTPPPRPARAPHRGGRPDRGRRRVRADEARGHPDRRQGSGPVPGAVDDAGAPTRRSGRHPGGGVRHHPQPDDGVDGVAAPDPGAVLPAPSRADRSVGRRRRAPPPRDDHPSRQRARRRVDRRRPGDRRGGGVHQPVRPSITPTRHGRHHGLSAGRRPAAGRVG